MNKATHGHIPNSLAVGGLFAFALDDRYQTIILIVSSRQKALWSAYFNCKHGGIGRHYRMLTMLVRLFTGSNPVACASSENLSRSYNR